MDIKVQKLHQQAMVPTQAHVGDAGWDLYAVEDATIAPGERHTFNLGIAVEFAQGHVALIRDRSSLGAKGITVLAGVIDASYRGEWKIVLLNTTKEDFSVRSGERIAQALFLPIVQPTLREVESLSETTRSSGGFGSTGQ